MAVPVPLIPMARASGSVSETPAQAYHSDYINLERAADNCPEIAQADARGEPTCNPRSKEPAQVIRPLTRGTRRAADAENEVVIPFRKRTLEGAVYGTVTLPNRARNKSAGMLGSRRSDDVAPRLHRRGPEGSVRFCGGEMALDVESVVSGCVG
jgi:hypothetical protein